MRTKIPHDDEDLLRRAYAAWFRDCDDRRIIKDQPASPDSAVERHRGKYYVVLRNVRGVLKVYRLRPNGALKGLKRYPKALDK
jgi:hypothetical protein